MIAAVAAWPIVAGMAAERPVLSKARLGPIAAQVRALIRRNSKNVEIVTFADRRLAPVRIVRGESEAPSAPIVHGSVAIVSFSGKNMKAVRILRSGTPGAAVATVPALRPRRRATIGGTEIVRFADPLERPVTVLRGSPAAWPDSDPFAVAASGGFELFPAARGADLDRIAFAVDGAESSHGMDPGMWRPEFAGPQGPMQVSAAAAIDLGGGNRFDPMQNRLLGRAYLARLYRRYGNWPDAVAAYNWGPGNMDMWIAGGRPAAGFPLEVERYRDRVLRDGGFGTASDQPRMRTGSHPQPP